MVSTLPDDRPLTVADLDGLPDDGQRYELIWGELYCLPTPDTKHQRSSRRLLVAIHEFLIQSGVGEVFPGPLSVQFDRYNLVLPDLIVVGASKREIIHDRGVEGAPDLCIEILTSGWQNYDMVKKNVLYRRFGVPEYWIVDPERERITVYVREAIRYMPQESDNGVARSVIFPGLEIDSTGIARAPAGAIEKSNTKA